MASSGAATFDSTLIGNSIWLDGSADFLNRQNGSDFSNRKEVTLSFWVQRNKFSSQQAIFAGLENGEGFIIQFMSGDTFQLYLNGTANLTTNAVFRDIGWYHILVSIDTSQAVSSDRSKVYINGEQITSFSSAAYPSQDSNIPGISGEMTSSENMRIGNYNNGVSNFYFHKGYVTQACMIESKSIQQGDFTVSDFLDTYTFGTNGSQFIPKKDSTIAALASAAGGNSFCLDFGDSSDLGNDISSNNNDFTPTSIDSANQTVHTPSLQFPVLNALNGDATLVGSLGYGNRLAVGVSSWDSVFATKSMGSSGKYYYEVRMHTETGSNGFIAGIHEESTTSKNWAKYIGNSTSTYGLGYALYTATNGFYTNGSVTSISGYTSNIAAGDIVMMAVDLDNNKLYWGVNGTFFNSGDPANGTGASTTIQADTEYVFGLSTSASEDYFVNFGQDSTFGGETTAGNNTDANGVGDFKYTVPTGFQCLASSSLTAPDYQGIDYFDATLYEGNGTGQRVGDFVPFTDAYTVTNSVMFEDGDSRSLTLNSSATRTSATVAAFSLWTKRGNLGINARPLTVQVDGNNYFSIYYNTSDQLDFTINNGGATILQRITTRAFKDTSAWHNIVVIINQGEGTQADRVKVFYDGVQIANDSTGFGTNTCTLDGSSALNFLDSASAVHDVGGGSSTAFTQAYDGYVAEVAFLDGADRGGKLNASDFGQVDTSTNRWIPKDIGSYNFGNTGYYLEFKVAPGTSNGAGTDTSGESNNFTSNGSWATTDQFVDCPSQNFEVWDGGRKAGNTLSEGNLKVTGDSGGDWDSVLGTMFVSSGKYYWEVERDSDPAGADRFRAGVAIDSYPLTTAMDSRTDAWGISENGQKLGGGLALTNYGDSTTTGDFIGVALDMDRNAIYFSKNGTWMNSASASGIADGTDYSKAAFSNVIGSVTPFLQTYDAQVATLRTASGRWEGTAPTGFLELNQDNLDDTASKITALSLIKNRDATDDFIWQDRVMGASGFLSTTRNTAGTSGISSLGDGGNDLLTTNANMAQRFLQRGVQVGNDDAVNTANESYVLWQWLLGESATTGSSITTGSPDMATTGIVSDANHFSIVQYTGNGSAGASFAHGLGSKPELVIIKRITGSTTNSDWITSTQGLGLADNNYFFLQYNLAVQTSTSQIRTGDITNDLVVVGNGTAVNVNTQTHQAYCFRSVPGLCKVGVYEGNGSSDGVYISLGFKPRFVLLRNADAQQDWRIYDTAVEPINPNDQFFKTNRNAAQVSSTGFDFLSDGLKARDSNAGFNSSATFIYLAMAEIGGNGTLPPIYGR